MLSALLVKKVGNKFNIIGPKTSEQVATEGYVDIDLVLILSDYKTMNDPKYSKDLEIFNMCTDKSKLEEEAQKRIRHVRPISYMLGTILSEDIKNLKIESLEYVN